ncbi:hypothetical protein KGF42_03770 [Clostridioides sp. ZZV15-6383]|uniref:hypothetical protein n=1 Tax=unclassified Clostridioides TaxID=2635829 RepID=UPI001D11544B|nr:hypothetical protein [Clostridioides sp. ZZV14-6345]MCC0698577.1 hypothetical protein [Clostridioides sp. ZZV15-6383]
MRILELSVDEYKQLENIKDSYSSKVDEYGLIIKDTTFRCNDDEFINIKIHKNKLLMTKDFICFYVRPINQ